MVLGKVRRRWLERPPRDPSSPHPEPPRRCAGEDGRGRRAGSSRGRGMCRGRGMLGIWSRSGSCEGDPTPCKIPVCKELRQVYRLCSEDGDHLRVVQYTESMRIPHTLLSPTALRAVVEEFVTRDGTDHSSVERRIETVMRQLDSGHVVLHFDDKTKTCHILPAEEKPPAVDADE